MTSKKITLTVDKDFVLLIDSDGSDIYNIRKIELPETREKVYSEWIMQLLSKSWVTIDLLYDLAVLIEREFPDHSIDWYLTFFAVEKKNYLDYAGDIFLPDDESSVQNVISKIKFNRAETNEETHRIIDEIVKGKLEEYHLVR